MNIEANQTAVTGSGQLPRAELSVRVQEMKNATASLLLALITGTATGRDVPVETLVLPREYEALAAAHNCIPLRQVLKAADPSDPFKTSPFDFRNVPPKAMLVGWCTKVTTGSTGVPSYILLFQIQSPENPIRYCPDEIHDIKRIGSPSFEAGPMIPHDFVFLGTNERPTVTEPRIMAGVRIRTPGNEAYYACMGGRWALYTPL